MSESPWYPPTVSSPGATFVKRPEGDVHRLTKGKELGDCSSVFGLPRVRHLDAHMVLAGSQIDKMDAHEGISDGRGSSMPDQISKESTPLENIPCEIMLHDSIHGEVTHRTVIP